jgi:hypothetical protein
MNTTASQILTAQLQASHGLLQMTMADVTPEVASFTPPGTANSIADTYVHILLSEDWLIHFLLQQKDPLYASEWNGKTGVDALVPATDHTFPAWTKNAKIDMDQLNKYKDVVFATSEAYVKALSDEDLQKEADLSSFGMGKSTVSFVVSSVVTNNVNLHIGEISAMKGIQGLKGYPM